MFWHDLTVFLDLVWRDWVGKMCGIFGLLWTIAAIQYPQVSPWIFGVLCVLSHSSLPASRIWRRSFHEARPYKHETYEHAKAVVNALPDEAKAFLKTVVIKKLAKGDGMYGG